MASRSWKILNQVIKNSDFSDSLNYSNRYENDKNKDPDELRNQEAYSSSPLASLENTKNDKTLRPSSLLIASEERVAKEILNSSSLQTAPINNMEADQTYSVHSPLSSSSKEIISSKPISPLPPSAENINVDLADVWNDVFGSDQDTPQILTLPTVSEEPQVQVSVCEELTPLNIEVSSSYNNSPAVCIEEFEHLEVSTPKSSQLYLSTPMPSPLNTHKTCNDPFCPNHNSVTTWVDSVNSVEFQEETELSSPKSESNNNIRNSKKRSQRKLEWSDVKRKRLTNLGKSYISKRGKLVNEKLIGNVCNCKSKCGEKICEKDRLEVFTKFWQLGDREKQWLFIIKHVEKSVKKRCLNGSPNRRQYTFKYFLPVLSKATDTECSTAVIVCKTMFLNTLSVSERTVKTAFQKYVGESDTQRDNRGRHSNRKTVINDVMQKSVCDHVNSFVPVESHYCRKDSTKLYLDGTLSVARMFKMYQEWFDSTVYSSKVETERQYRDIVNKNFNLAFHIPKKDQCTTCHSYRNKSHHSDEEKMAHNKHLLAKKSARNLKKIDKQTATDSNGSVLAAVFDFEKVLSCPHGDVNIYYYKRKLSFFNFTIFDMGKKKGVCYLWDETVANRGANEVASCLLEFIDCNVKEGIKEFRFWSDNCPGQNKNRFVFSLFLFAAKKYKVSITHRFLEKGHTQNEGDSVHALIERSASCKSIYTPDEWRLLIRWAKVEGEPYIIKNMIQENFFDFKSHVNDRIWSKNTNKQTIAWLEIKEVFVDKLEPNKLFYKYDLDQENYDCLVVSNATRNSLILPELKRAYSTSIKLSRDKYKDLINMVETHVIPEEYSEYFKRLPHRTTGKNALSD